jgi:hypothetical protein
LVSGVASVGLLEDAVIKRGNSKLDHGDGEPSEAVENTGRDALRMRREADAASGRSGKNSIEIRIAQIRRKTSKAAPEKTDFVRALEGSEDAADFIRGRS